MVHSIGVRLKKWRDSVKLSQKDAATQLSFPARTYQDYERDLRSPGAESMEAFVRAGINANWLLTGEGPMLLAELARKEAQSPRINAEALSAILRGLLEAGAPPAKACTAAVEFYQISIDRGDITPDGIGDGQKAAA